MPTLLLADDSTTVQRVIQLTLAGQDIDVVAVNDGEQAVARIDANRPDIVLADIDMPKRSGYDVCTFIKNRPDLARIPVLLLAGAFDPVDQSRAAQVQCDGVLMKPLEPAQLAERVRELLNGATGSAARAVAGVPRPVERLVGPAITAVPDAARAAVAPLAPPATPTPATSAPAATASAASEPAAGGQPSTNDYFDRLDAAFASLGDRTPAAAAAPDDEDDVPTLDKVLSRPADPPTSLPLSSPPPAPGVAPVAPRPLADAFNALLAAELVRVEPDAADSASTTYESTNTDALVEEVTRRVLERLRDRS